MRNGQVAYNDAHRKPGYAARTENQRKTRARHPDKHRERTQRYYAKHGPGPRSRKHYNKEEDFLVLFAGGYTDPILAGALGRSVCGVQQHRSELVMNPLPLIEWYGLDKEEK